MANESSHWAKQLHPVVQASLALTESQNLSAPKILNYIFNIYKPESVADLGCGLGTWLLAAKNIGVKRVRGYDIGEVDIDSRKILPEEFIEADFRKELNFDKRYDLAISLEVAEHIPHVSSDVYISSLTNASDIILFAAAIPYQGGMGHVNENWLEYWAEKFYAHGYECYDIIREEIWHDPSIAYFYRQNIVLFSNKSTITIFKDKGFSPTLKPKSYIHPEMYIKAVTRSFIPQEGRIFEDVRNYYKYALTEKTKALAKKQHIYYGKEKYNIKDSLFKTWFKWLKP